MRFYTTEQLGEKQSFTPEGFLLCADVPIARTGQMIYGPDETPIAAGDDGVVRIDRSPEEVFRPETIASFAGKPVTNDHPPEDVNPDNWKQYDVGTVLNPRRGEGTLADLLLGDLLIKERDAIDAVRGGKREISAGYDAGYYVTGPGRGYQTQIVGNHVALVDQGRCGPRCRIGDQRGDQFGDRRDPRGDRPDRPEIAQLSCASAMESLDMKRTTVLDRLLQRAFKAKDEGELANIREEGEHQLDQAEGAENHVHVHLPGIQGGGAAENGGDNGTTGAVPAAATATGITPEARDQEVGQRLSTLEGAMKDLGTRFDAFEQRLAGNTGTASEAGDGSDNRDGEAELAHEMPAGAADRIHKGHPMRDSALLEDSFQDTVAIAEILAPGIRIPVFDRAAVPMRTFDAMCRLRRQALDLAYGQPATRGMIDAVLGGQAFSPAGMSCAAVRTLFRAAGALQRQANNTAHATHAARATHDDARSGSGTSDAHAAHAGPPRIRTLADLNRANAEHYRQ